MKKYEIVVVGAGAAGIAAAQSAYMNGCRSVLLIDSRKKLGGVLLQCAHRGFGPQLTGVEYIEKMLKKFPGKVRVLLETTVLSIDSDRTMVVSGSSVGLQKIQFEQLILATGCMEIPMGFLPVAGTRPDGIYTAGQIQEMVNLHKRIPEGPVVILGSGDLGLIMAAQLVAEGVEIAAIVEQKESCGGMAKNQRCIKKHEIPLICSATITEVLGSPNLTGVKVRKSDKGEETEISCRSLLVAAGLRPDRSLIHGLEISEWLHLCGNCHMVHPVVEAVIAEGCQAGAAAWSIVRNKQTYLT